MERRIEAPAGHAVGQLIVFETVFALLYGFVYDHRLPRVLEIAALVLLLAGVYGSVRRHSDTHAADDPLNANLTAH